MVNGSPFRLSDGEVIDPGYLEKLAWCLEGKSKKEVLNAIPEDDALMYFNTWFEQKTHSSLKELPNDDEHFQIKFMEYFKEFYNDQCKSLGIENYY